MNLVKNKLRVTHMPQIPCKGFSVEVASEREAYLIKETLANQHLFLFENNMIPDYANIIIIEMLENGQWCDYYNEQELMEWEDFILEYGYYVTTGEI